MTPRQKAEEITLLYYNLGKHLYVPISFAKQCALIAVDEILEVVKFYEKQNGKLLIDNIRVMYWQEVKKEIENL